jgi:hypothetical protein
MNPWTNVKGSYVKTNPNMLIQKPDCNNITGLGKLYRTGKNINEEK